MNTDAHCCPEKRRGVCTYTRSRNPPGHLVATTNIHTYLCHPLEVVFVEIEVDISPLLVFLFVGRALRIARPEHALRPEAARHRLSIFSMVVFRSTNTKRSRSTLYFFAREDTVHRTRPWHAGVDAFVDRPRVKRSLEAFQTSNDVLFANGCEQPRRIAVPAPAPRQSEWERKLQQLPNDDVRLSKTRQPLRIRRYLATPLPSVNLVPVEHFRLCLRQHLVVQACHLHL